MSLTIIVRGSLDFLITLYIFIQVSHEFPLNGNPANPYCYGVHGIVEAYRQAVDSVKLYGPTNMAPIINHVANFAEVSAANGDYQVINNNS